MSDACRLLVIDDDVNIREMLDMVLVSEGFEVIAAPHGAAGLRLLDQVRPHVILLDMKMPVMDGWQFVEALRARVPDPPAIVVLTAAPDPAERAAEVGAQSWLGKPFETEEVLAQVRRFVHLA